MIEAVEALQRVPLLGGLSKKEFERLAKDFTERVFPAGSTVIKQGEERGIGFFVIAEGEAAVSVDGTEIDRMGPGDHFGEIALLGDRVRTATVTAVTELRCLVMTLWEFRSFVQSDADVAWKLLGHLAGLLHDARLAPARARGRRLLVADRQYKRRCGRDARPERPSALGDRPTS